MGIYTNNYITSVIDVGEQDELSNKGYLRILQEIAIQAYGSNNINEIHRIWILLNWKLKVFSRPNLNTKIMVKTWPKNIFKYYLHRDFEVYDEYNNLIAIASSKWALTNTITVMKIPKEVQDEFQFFPKSVFKDEDIPNLKEPENFEITFEYTIQRRDIDTNHHVNNTVYVDFAYESLPKEIYDNVNFENLEITYKHEAKLGDKIVCLYKELENGEHFVTIKNKSSGKTHAIIKLF